MTSVIQMEIWLPILWFLLERTHHPRKVRRPHGLPRYLLVSVCWDDTACIDMGQRGWDKSKTFQDTIEFLNWNQRYGASIKPYADFTSLHTSLGLRFMAFTSSGTGSTAILRSSWVLPWRKAALMSKDPSVQSIEATTCAIIIFDVRPRVGESRGMVSSCGSRCPNTTSRAFAFLVFPSSFCSFGHSTGFHT